MDLVGHWEGESVEPPDAAAVACRLLSLLVMDLRCSIETRCASGQREAVMTWEEATGVIEGVKPHLHSIERELLFEMGVGSWDPDLRRDVHWLLEAQAILRWALGSLADAPSADEMMKAGSLGPGPLLAPNSFIDGASLRSGADLERAEALWSFWLWRSHAGPFRGRRLLPPHVREAVDGAVAAEILEPDSLLEGDVQAFGQPVFRLDEDRQELLTSIATERCRAARWLCGHAEGFYEISLETSVLWGG